MKKLIFSMAVISLFACGEKKDGDTNEESKVTYPDKWEKDMSVEISNGGGMDPGWYKIYISYDSCYIEEGYLEIKNKWYFSLVTDYLDSLAGMIKENDIANIRSEEAGGTIYDKATTSLVLNMGGKEYKMEDSATELIKGDAAKRFKNVRDLVYTLGRNEVNRLSSVFYFLPDKKLLAAKPKISILDYDYTSAYNSEELGLVDSIYLFLLPGNHRFTINIIDSLGKIEPFDTVWNCKISSNAKEFMKLNFNKGKISMDPSTTVVLDNKTLDNQ